MTNASLSLRYLAGIRVTPRLREQARQQLARPARKLGGRGRDQTACNPKLPKDHVTTALLSTFLVSNRGVIIRRAIMTGFFIPFTRGSANKIARVINL